MHLRREHLLALPLLIGLGVVADRVGAAPPPAPTANVVATADAWISQAPSHANHGADAKLQVGGPGRGRSLVRFATSDLLTATGGRSLVSARLELTIAGTSNQWGHGSHGLAARTVDVHRVTHARSWTEGGATWESPDDAGPRPATRWDMRARDDDLPYDADATASVAIAANQTGVISLDVTADVVAWLSTAAPNEGWLLRRRDEERGNGLLELRTRTGTGAPRLVLSLGASAATSLVAVSGDGQQARPGERFAAPLVVAVRDAAGAGVVGRPVTFAVAAGAATLDGPASATTDGAGRARVGVRLGATASGPVRITATAPGLAGSPVNFTLLALPPPTPVLAVADSYVERLQPNRAHGNEGLLRIRPLGLSRALVRVDQAAIDAALAGGTLERAVLEVELHDVDVLDGCDPDTFAVGVHRMTQAWTEAGATWNSPADANTSNFVRDGPSWSMRRPPFPFATTATATTTLVDRQTGAATWDVTADVQAFIAGAQNHGWLLKSVREFGPGRAHFRSRESSTPPRLLLYVRDTTAPLLTFTSPAEGAVAGPTGLARLTFSDPSGLQPGSLVVRANGVDVTVAFTVTAEAAQAPLASLAGSLDQGTNALSASIKDTWGHETAASRLFVFDSIGPTLSLEPASGATVTSASVLLHATYADAPAGVAPTTFSATLDGAPIAFAVGPAEATATSPLLAGGSHTLVVSVADLAGNVSTATTTFTVDAAGSLFGVVGSGTSAEEAQVLGGVRVRAYDGSGTEAVTDEYGQFTLTGLRPGLVQVVADGYEVGHGRTALVMTVGAGGLTLADRAWIVPPLGGAGGAAFQLDGAGRTTSTVVVTNPGIPGASVTVQTGTRVIYPPGFAFPAGTTPAITLHRVAFSVLGNPLPPTADPDAPLHAPFAYALQPEGVELVEGYDLVIPNDQGFSPGESVPFLLFSEALGAYEPKSDLVVSADGLTLSGRVNSQLGPGVAPKPGAAYAISVPMGFTASSPRNFTVQSGGQSLAQQSSPPLGTPTANLVVVGPRPGPTGPPALPPVVAVSSAPSTPSQPAASTISNVGIPIGTVPRPGINPPAPPVVSIVVHGPFVNRNEPAVSNNGNFMQITHSGNQPLHAVNGSIRRLMGPAGPGVFEGPANAGAASGAPVGVLPDGPFAIEVSGTSTRVSNAGLVDRTPPTGDPSIGNLGILDSGPNAGLAVAKKFEFVFVTTDAPGGLWRARGEVLSPSASVPSSSTSPARRG